MSIEIGSISPTKNYGEVKVINKYKSDKDGRFRYDVEFVDTGYLVKGIAGSSIIRGKIKDIMKPSVYGVGYIGGKKYTSKSNPKAYEIWRSMLSRCYCKPEKFNPSYVNCFVHPDWHNFQTFAVWFEYNYVEGMHLDKDLKIKGNKIYSADHCQFVTSEENQSTKAVKFSCITPEGKKISGVNLNKFCKDNGLKQSSMWELLFAKNKLKTHKGYRKAYD